jgi:hypothetical protein
MSTDILFSVPKIDSQDIIKIYNSLEDFQTNKLHIDTVILVEKSDQETIVFYELKKLGVI